jgi:hypothetical protein
MKLSFTGEELMLSVAGEEFMFHLMKFWCRRRRQCPDEPES